MDTTHGLGQGQGRHEIPSARCGEVDLQHHGMYTIAKSPRIYPMEPRFRIKCPVCGMWNSQGRLNQDHLPFEVATYTSTGLGRGKGFRNTWQRLKLKGAKALFLLTLAAKLRRVADRLEMEAQALGSTSTVASALGASASMRPWTSNAPRYASSWTSPALVEELVHGNSRIL